MNKYPVVKQLWEESERGWGIRPDGYSLHLNEEDRKNYVSDFNKTLPSYVPDEYSRVSGSPTIIDVDSKLYKEIKASKNGIRVWR